MRLTNELNEAYQKALPSDQYAKLLQEQKVQWVVNSEGELGVEVDGQAYFMYKGDSFIYSTALDHTTLRYRPVGKREFGESGPTIDTDNFESFHYDHIKALPLYDAKAVAEAQESKIKGLLHAVKGWESTEREEFIKELLPLLTMEQLTAVHAQQFVSDIQL